METLDSQAGIAQDGLRFFGRLTAADGVICTCSKEGPPPLALLSKPVAGYLFGFAIGMAKYLVQTFDDEP